MKLINMPRGSGKTTKAIELSAENGYYIVCRNMEEARRIHIQAQESGFDINYPVVWAEFKQMKFLGGIKGMIVDDCLDLILDEALTGAPVKYMTVTVPVTEEKQDEI